MAPPDFGLWIYAKRCPQMHKCRQMLSRYMLMSQHLCSTLSTWQLLSNKIHNAYHLVRRDAITKLNFVLQVPYVAKCTRSCKVTYQERPAPCRGSSAGNICCCGTCHTRLIQHCLVCGVHKCVDNVRWAGSACARHSIRKACGSRNRSSAGAAIALLCCGGTSCGGICAERFCGCSRCPSDSPSSGSAAAC